jgi:hypothetical protein
MPTRRARPILKGVEHGLSCYKAGCGCAKGRKANRDYSAKRRAEKRDADAQDFSDNVTRLRSVQGGKSAESNDSPDNEIGEVEQSVLDACLNIEGASDKPDVVMMARRMARILDTDKQVHNHPTATRQLAALMDSLRGVGSGKGTAGKRKSGSRLATVQSMTRSKRAQ